MKLVRLGGLLLGGCVVVFATNPDCLACHTKLRDRIESAVSRHRPLCTDCHEAHAGQGKPKLKQTAGALCTSCHGDIAEGKKFVHGALRAPCIVCHDPHAPDFPHILRAATNELCMECHEGGFGPGAALTLFKGAVKVPRQLLADIKPLAVRSGHPVPLHPVFAPADVGQREINCLSCHTPHASEESKDLLVSGASGRKGLCGKCHSPP